MISSSPNKKAKTTKQSLLSNTVIRGTKKKWYYNIDLEVEGGSPINNNFYSNKYYNF